MHILFVADPLESFKIYKDTTFAMMRELHRRGHRVSACESAGHRCGCAVVW
jgi:glutathione synthase